MWIERLDPLALGYQLKLVIRNKTGWAMERFRLMTRERVVDEVKSLRENGIDAESIVYITINK